MVLNNTNFDGSWIVAEKMRELVQTLHFTFESGHCSVTISAGVCGFVAIDSGDPVPEFEELIKEADDRLYKAKQNGRNRVEKRLIGNRDVS